MALPVVIVPSGGLPMNRLSAHGGLPVTLAAQGLAVTEGLPGLGLPMTFVTEGGSVVLPVPPEPTDPNFANVELLLGFEGADAATTTTDQSPDARAVTFTGNAQIDTAQFKFGASSLLLDGVDDIVTVPDSTDWDFTGQFTIECWFRPSVMTGGTKTLICKRGAASTNISWDFTATLGATSGIGFELSTDGTTTVHNVSAAAAGLLAANTWYHIAADRDASNKIRIYLTGAMRASKAAATGTPFNSTNALSIGGRANTGQPFPGWIDEVRITRGVARYASDSGFTVPSAAFPRS